MVVGEPAKAIIMQFAKWPEEERVKTRLMPLLGAKGALVAHVRLTLAVLEQLRASGYPLQFWWDRALAEAPEAARPVVASLEAHEVTQQVQQGASLGDRMSHALACALQAASRAVIVGSDCPSVDAAYVRQAVSALNSADVVLGPSEDGGYVLIGARRVVPGMLDEINWGTDQVLGQTRERLESLGLTVALLESRWDVDEPEDWQRFIGQSPD